MSGLLKAKQYDWKDTNMSLFGSDAEKSVKLESAQSEPAWQGVGEEVGLKIWRVEVCYRDKFGGYGLWSPQFEIVEWPEADKGKFYDGDSYIILNTYKDEESDELNYDVHFWIGRHSSQDEYGTAAYKTVELDTYLKDAAVQHREVMGCESVMFKSYFDRFIVMSGGAASGFNHVTPEQYRFRLMKFNRNVKKVEMTEIARSRKNLKTDDVFVLDCGLKAYQWNGAMANKDEKYKAALYHSVLELERGRVVWKVIDEDEESDEFYDNLDEDDDEEDEEDEEQEKALFKVSADDGAVEFTEVARGDCVGKGLLESGDVFVIATDSGVCVWVGSGSSDIEKKNGLTYAHEYLRKNGLRKKGVIVLKEGQRETLLDTYFV